MQICPRCGAFLMEGWDRCRICGHDPAAAPAAEPTVPTASKRASKPPKAPKEPKATVTPAPVRSEPSDRGRPVLAVAAVVVAVVAGYLLWYDPSPTQEPATAGSTLDATTSTTAPVVAETSPAPTAAPLPTAPPPAPTPSEPSREAFASAIGGLVSDDLPLPGDAWPCAGRLVVDVLGGAPALAAQGLSPDDFANRATAGRLAAPAGVVDLVAAALAGCGIDMTDLVVRRLAATNQATVVACIAAGLDRDLGNRSLATELVTGTEAMVPGAPYYDHVLSVAIGCGG